VLSVFVPIEINGKNSFVGEPMNHFIAN
jgi:hypothetical protein